MTYHDPGVAYSTLGPCAYASRKNTPAFSFGSGAHKERFANDPKWKDAVPGPGAYAVEGDTLRSTAPLVKPGLFSNTRWTADATVRTNLGLPRHKHTLPPGPGLYLRSRSSVNLTGSPQVLARWRNATQAGWQDYSPRECQTPVVVSREHERERYGTHSPGPMTAAPQDSVGKQLTSTRKTQPRCAFGRSERFSTAALKASGAVPGPGAYSY